MPSTYAHFRMGQQVRNRLDGEKRRVIERYPELFQVGLHGPDILFYYNPLIKNRVNRVGSEQHERSGEAFFSDAAAVIREHPGEDAYLSYCYGVLCHFGLDSACHGYINRHVTDSGIAHNEIETEFDRMLMVHDAHDPIRRHQTRHIERAIRRFDFIRAANKRGAAGTQTDPYEVIRAFYPGIRAEDVRCAMQGMVLCHAVFRAPCPLKRAVLFSLMRLIGKYDTLRGYFVNYEADPACAESNAVLRPLYQDGLRRSLELIRTFDAASFGEGLSNPLYSYNFEGLIA